MASLAESERTDGRSPLAAFAADLDELRRAAGLSYRDLARLTRQPRSTLNDALRGRRFPRLDTVLAIVRGCGGAQAQWRERWLELKRSRLRGTASYSSGAPSRDTAPVPGQATIRSTVPRQLPPDIDDFAGRRRLLATIHAALTDRASPTALPVVVLTGPGGVGKTALAVRAAHLAAARYPDGQLAVNLHGTDVVSRDPAEVLTEFLVALGLDQEAVPAGFDHRISLFRTRVAGRRMLVLLDNAATAGQVRPLLPGTEACAVLITSRSPLAGLAGARHVDVGLLTEDEARELLRRQLGEHRVRREPAATDEVVRLCGRLPLALRVSAARLAARPRWPVAMLASLLGDERGRLDQLRAGDLEVRSNVQLSYRGQGELARRVFRRLACIETTTFAPWVAGALAGVPTAEAERALEALTDARLIESAGQDGSGQPRYGYHDLLRLFARERLEAEEPVGQRADAVASLGRLSLRLARQLAAVLAPGRPCTANASPEDADHEPLRRDPVSWFQQERTTFRAVAELGLRHGKPELTCELVATLADVLEVTMSWTDWAAMVEFGQRAAAELDDQRTTGVMARLAGTLSAERGEFERAVAALEESRRLLAATGETHERALATFHLAELLVEEGQYELALGYYQECLAAFRRARDRRGVGWTLRGLGTLERRIGGLGSAEANSVAAIGIFTELGDRYSIAYARQTLAAVLLSRGDLDGARRELNGALRAVGGPGARRETATIMYHLAKVNHKAGRLDQAAAQLTECLTIADELGDRAGYGYCLHELATVYADRGDTVAAVQRLRRCVELFSELGLASWVDGTRARLDRLRQRAS